MTEFRDFDASNQPGTCLYCGRRLRWVKQVFTPGLRGELIPPSQRPNLYAKPGDYGDGFFCGLRCGYQFGVLAAEHGKRFEKKTRE